MPALSAARTPALAGLCLALAACTLSAEGLAPGDTGPGAGDSSTTGTATAQGGAGGTGGAASSGGGGVGGATPCEPGTSRGCYTGPSGTEGQGPCQGGTETCLQDGTDYGPCEGEVVPATESCATIAVDEDCDGASDTDSDCACVPGTTEPCYDGPPGTAGIGICVEGSRTCLESGRGFTDCTGEIVPAIENCVAAPDEDCDAEAAACTGQTLWGFAFGGVNADDAIAAEFDASGDLVFAGRVYDNAVFPDGTSTSDTDEDILVGKVTPAATLAYRLRFGDDQDQRALAVATDDQNNVIVAGIMLGSVDFGGGTPVLVNPDNAFTTMFLAKLDPAGNALWSKRFVASAEGLPWSVDVDGAGNVLVTGQFLGTLQVDPAAPVLTNTGGGDGFVAKFDAAGAHVFSRAFTSAATGATGWRVVADPAGNVIVAGNFRWAGVVRGGPALTATATDAFVVKLDPSGNHLWSKRYGDAMNQTAFGAGVDATGAIVIAGSFQSTIGFGGASLVNASGGPDVFVAKLDGNGTEVWSKSFGTTGLQEATFNAVDPFGNVLVVGRFDGTFAPGGAALPSGGNLDAFAMKLDANGAFVWAHGFGGLGDDVAYGVSASPIDARVGISGQFDESITFLGQTTSDLGSTDGFVASLAP